MGTRNLTMVIDQEGVTKIAQYGQWDGYPSGQGATALEFLKKKGNIERLRGNLKKTRFLDFEGRDKELLAAYNKNAPNYTRDPDHRTNDQKYWFSTYMSRDLGAEILQNVADADNDKEILLKDSTEFGNDDLFCEWCYTVNLQKNTFEVAYNTKSKPIKVYSLSDLPQGDRFIKETEIQDED